MKFIRTTAQYHQDPHILPRISESQQECWDSFGLIGHMTESDRAMTFDEIVEEHHKYNDQEKEPRESEAFIALGLIRLVEQKLVGVVS